MLTKLSLGLFLCVVTPLVLMIILVHLCYDLYIVYTEVPGIATYYLPTANTR